jgi:hypothetical protein
MEEKNKSPLSFYLHRASFILFQSQGLTSTTFRPFFFLSLFCGLAVQLTPICRDRQIEWIGAREGWEIVKVQKAMCENCL